jgi:uncharacterized protein YcgL (UPF0745 family)
MKVDIYRAKKSPSPYENIYIFVPEGSNVENLPDEIKEKAGGFDLEKKLDIKPGEKRIALNTDEAIKNIEEKGYHVQGSKIEVQIRVGGQKTG